MPKRGDKEYLLDIIEAIRRIEVYTKELSYPDFLQKMETQDAVVRNFENIGEMERNRWDEGQSYPFLFWGKLGYCLGGCKR